LAFLASPGSPSQFIQKLVGNLNQALATVQATGKVAVVLGNLPDITATPYFQQNLAGQPGLKALVQQLPQAANQQILALAQARGVPVVDLYGLNNLATTLGKVEVGGVDVTALLYGPDGFHPSSVGQSLLLNTILEAFHRGYGLNLDQLTLHD